jgi:hypothetical protein
MQLHAAQDHTMAWRTSSGYENLENLFEITNVEIGEDPEYKMSIQFNAKYNEDIFVHSTKFEDGSEV